MKTKKILAVGNSFSDDAMAYLYQMASADNVEVKTVNLYIGGCSLQRHCENIDSGDACYEYHLNGRETDRMISIKEALQEEDWDYITIQQASHDSGQMDSYYPYTEKLLAYVREYCKEAKILLHQTWAYETDSTHELFGRYDYDQGKMYAALKACYSRVQEEFGLEVIPSGDLIQKLRGTKEFDYKNGGISLCRDGFHMSFDYGRYAVAALWYKILCDGDIANNSFLPENAENGILKQNISMENINLIKKMVETMEH